MTARPELPVGVDGAAVRAALAAMGSMPYVSVLVVDTAMRYQAVLGAAVRRHGYDPALLLGRPVEEVLPPGAFARIGPSFRRALDGGTFVQVAESADGAAVYETAYGPVLEDGAVIGAVAVVRDVTVEHRAVTELAEALEIVELSFAAAPIGTALVSPDGTFLKVNAALCTLLGRDEQALLGLDFSATVHPEDLPADLDLPGGTAAGVGEGLRRETRHLRPDGTVVWAQLAVSVVRDAAGRPRFSIVHLADVTDRKAALQEMDRLATTDPLTGLPNRALLVDRLRHALSLARRGGGLVGVISVDLDSFKEVNDRLGHDAGDELLRRTAERITRAAREGDTTTRLGGDEFVVVCAQISALDDVTRIAERIRAELHRPFEIVGTEVRVTAGIGVTAGRNTTGEALLREADRTMHSAKLRPQGRVGVFTEALEVIAHDQLGLRAALADGITRGELVVHYQPIVHLATGTVVAREALVRWQHPTLGLLSPSAFLDDTDRSDPGLQVGEHVLARACGDAATWEPDVAVHVNISARHLAQPQFPGVVRDCLTATGLAPERLVLEITEGPVLAAAGSTLTTARALSALGVGLGLDGFGTGCSSIAALHRLPVDSFTIDRSFVADMIDDPASGALVEALIALGSHMDLDVIAEGIETAEQADWLAGRGCPHGQGFLFGRPAAL